MKLPSVYYTKVNLLQATNRMRFASLTELVNYVSHHHVSTVFCISHGTAADAAISFGIMHNNILLEHPSQGFSKLEDYNNAISNHFPDATSYYEAQEAGYKKYDDYKLIHEAGIIEKETLEKIKQTGFMKGYDDFALHLQTHPDLVTDELAAITNAYLLYQFATTNGFQKYEAFKAAIDKGFTNKHAMDIAAELGFPTNATYNEGLQLGFRTYEELEAAKAANIKNNEDFTRYVQLKDVGEETNTFDERLLMVILSKIEQGKRLSVNKLYDFFIRTINEYQYPDTQEIPKWFTQQFNDRAVFNTFISTSPQLKKYGEYDNDGEFFQINKMQDRKVVLDGSNVAHNGGSVRNSTPSINNLIIMVEFLKQQGFTEVAIIVDASLKKKLHDPEKIDKLMEIAEYLVAPAETSADMFIIKFVKAKHWLVISNDTFREWKIKDAWVAENIDYYRLSFMIKDDEVLIPDLK